MFNKVFLVTGDKVRSFITDESSLKFSSKAFDTIEEFNESWDRKLSLASKIEIRYEAIKSVRKEDNDKDVMIKYRSYFGIPGECEFSFIDDGDYETFFSFLEKERYFSRRNEVRTPMGAIKNYLIGLAAVIGFTVFTYYRALEITKGTFEDTGSGKVKIFKYIVGLLGDKGVILVGGGIAIYLLYKIKNRYSNPPNQIILSPMNG